MAQVSTNCWVNEVGFSQLFQSEVLNCTGTRMWIVLNSSLVNRDLMYRNANHSTRMWMVLNSSLESTDLMYCNANHSTRMWMFLNSSLESRDLMYRNANHIIERCCHLPVSCLGVLSHIFINLYCLINI